MALEMIISYPETIPDALQATREQFEQEALTAMAVKLFEMKRLSSGMAASLLGISRKDFLFLLLGELHLLILSISHPVHHHILR